MSRRRPKQLAFTDRPTHGGKRKGAGRPRRGPRGSVAHTRRRPFRQLPCHVTLRFARRVWNLRSQRSLKVIQAALREGGAERFGARVVQLSLQGNHIHLLVEAADHLALSRAMKGLAVRIARGMNRMIGSPGAVLGDRYHARPLRTPTEVRHARHYIRHNHVHHHGAVLPAGFRDPFCSDAPELRALVAEPRYALTRGLSTRRVRANEPFK